MDERSMRRAGLSEAEIAELREGRAVSQARETMVQALPTVQERYGAALATAILEFPGEAPDFTLIGANEYAACAAELAAYGPARHVFRDAYRGHMTYMVAIKMSAPSWRAFWRRRVYGERA